MLHFNAASGLDAANDDVSWAPTDLVKQVAMRGARIIALGVTQSTDTMLLTPSAANVFDQL